MLTADAKIREEQREGKGVLLLSAAWAAEAIALAAAAACLLSRPEHKIRREEEEKECVWVGLCEGIERERENLRGEDREGVRPYFGHHDGRRPAPPSHGAMLLLLLWEIQGAEKGGVVKGERLVR